ncbi:MAG: formate--tetrahydrofolate ligase, partial [Bacteroidia bacterium]|nr:formate--tetrahydrofolate ligase [Bacteroidia bacterium]
MTDLDIAQNVEMQHINSIAAKLDINQEDLEQYGKHKAKLPLHLIEEEQIEKSNLILITALTPTPAGEGKTTVSIGLNEGL